MYHEKENSFNTWPDDICGNNSADSLLNYANNQFNADQAEAAIAILCHGRRDYPEDLRFVLASGIFCQHLGRHDEALKNYLEFVQNNSDSPFAMIGIASCLEAIGKGADAEFWYRQCLSIDPSSINAALRLANSLSLRQVWHEAENVVLKALEYYPAHSDLRFSLGYIYEKSGRIYNAMTVYNKLLQDDPTHSEAALNYLTLLHDQKALTQISELLPQLLLHHGKSAAILTCLGNIEFAHGRFDAALSYYDRAIQNDPIFSEAHCNRGATLEKLNRLPEALTALNEALVHEPSNAATLNNIGNVFAALGQHAKAKSAFHQSLNIRPDDPDTLANLASSLDALDLTSDALAVFDRAIARNQDHVGAHWNKGLVLLRQGHFRDGWPLYEWRFRAHDISVIRQHNTPRWRVGIPLSGKTLAVHWEQGLGDTIQFCRFIPHLVAAGARVQFEPQACLQRLMSTLKGTFELIGEGTEQADYHLPLMSLPWALGLTEPDFMVVEPYLSVPDIPLAPWTEILVSDPRPMIGICWQGSYSRVDRGRSVPLELFSKLATAFPEFHFISVQKGPAAQQLNAPANMIIDNLGSTFDNGPDAFCDSAAVIARCALVITVDTSVAHLAGALGCETWTLLQHYPDWRWMKERTDTPWYSKMHLFRQRRPGDWSSVFTDVASKLKQFQRRCDA